MLKRSRGEEEKTMTSALTAEEVQELCNVIDKKTHDTESSDQEGPAVPPTGSSANSKPPVVDLTKEAAVPIDLTVDLEEINGGAIV